MVRLLSHYGHIQIAMGGTTRRTLGIAGLLVLLMASGLVLTLYLDARHARKLDFRGFAGFFVMFKPCDPHLRGLSVPRRVMSEAESQVLTVVLFNPALTDGALRNIPVNGGGSRPAPCEVTVTLAAPDFNLGPPETSQTVRVPLGGIARLVWVLSPKKAGTFRVVAFLHPITPESDTAQIGITVHTVLGLTPIQADLLSKVGYVLGPILTIPYWAPIIARWRARWKNLSQAQKAPADAEARTPNSSGAPVDREQVAPGPKNRLV